MNKPTMRLTVSQLRNMISETIKRVLKETFVHQDIFDKEVQKYADAYKVAVESGLISQEVANTKIQQLNDKFSNITFKFGKYKDTPILDCDDMNYLKWYIENIGDNGETGKLIQQILDKEYSVKNYGNFGSRFMNKKGIENKNEIVGQIKNGGYSFFCEKNLSKDGTIIVDNVRFKFPHFRQLTYNGFVYGLPLKDGKCVKIKNKNITITEIWPNENFDEDTIKVKDFIIN